MWRRSFFRGKRAIRTGGLHTEEIALAWSQWLGQEPFHLFDTCTSAKRTHPEAMAKRVQWFVALLNVHYFGKRWKRRPWKAIQSVIAIERHKSGNPHAHALLRFPDGLPRDFPVRYWQDVQSKSGGFCKLEAPRAQQDVVDYCSKYVTKGGELVLSENYRPLTAQPSLFQAVEGSRFLVRHKAVSAARVRAILQGEDGDGDHLAES